jgi:starvation-inducible DNA-binding protein
MQAIASMWKPYKFTKEYTMTQTAQSLSASAQEAICEALNQAVAETVVTTMMAQNFHWNVTGMAFGPLHALFQEIYEDHFTAQDDLAERVKAIGGHANGVLADMVEASKVDEFTGHGTDKEMIAALAAAERVIAETLAGTAAVAEEHGDLLTQDLAIARGQVHEKFAWLLSAHLG